MYLEYIQDGYLKLVLKNIFEVVIFLYQTSIICQPQYNCQVRHKKAPFFCLSNSDLNIHYVKHVAELTLRVTFCLVKKEQFIHRMLKKWYTR